MTIESEADYSSMLRSANTLHCDSERYAKITENLLNDIQRLNSCWKGEDQAKFLRKISDCCDKLKNMSKQLDNLSEVISIQRQNFMGNQDGLASQATNLPV